MSFRRPFLKPEYNLFSVNYWLGRVDALPLSIFRIFYALFMIKINLDYYPVGHIFFSDNGVFPREVMWSLSRQARISLMDTIGREWLVYVFFALHLIIILALLFGWKTKTASILNFLFILSIHERNLFLLNGADTLVRVMAFWMMFLPAGAYFSVDSLMRRINRYKASRHLPDLRPNDVPITMFALPFRLMLLQVAQVYVFAAATKIPGGFWTGGEAIRLALQLETFQQPIGLWLFENTPIWLLSGLTIGTIVIEGAWIILVFAPIFQPFLRRLALLSTTLLHLGISMALSVQNFSEVMVITYTLFLSPDLYRSLGRRWRAATEPVQIEQPTLTSPLWLLLAWTNSDRIQLAQRTDHADPDETVPACDRWWVRTEDGQWIHGVGAWRSALGHLPLSHFWLWLVSVRPVRQMLWAFGLLVLANVRITKPLADSSPLPPQPEYRLLKTGMRVVYSAGLIFLMVTIVRWNLASISFGDWELAEDVGGAPREVMRYLGLYQSWRTFSPQPKRTYGPIVAEGTFENETLLDLRTGLPVGEEWAVWSAGPYLRWRKYEESLHDGNDPQRLQAWADYLCVQYNGVDGRKLPDGERLVSLEIWFYYRRTLQPDEEDAGQFERMLIQQDCIIIFDG